MFFSSKKMDAPVPFGVLDISLVSEVDRLTLDEGLAILVTPKTMSPDSIEDFSEWLFVYMERKERQNRRDCRLVMRQRRRRTVRHEGLGDKFYILNYPMFDGQSIQEKLEEKLRILKEQRTCFDEAIALTEKLIHEKEIADKVNSSPFIYK
ncbi:hypothetical protein [Gimesia aquarii]|uniref:Uncharacterized protein n=1 Tax=Gimesia aquarii TaxID=2527964 RepID=A0A517W3N7_9PLAN|nr:hypothetical protein [Gimesia aquarii]QDT99871.1 hypothetical protein V144x_53850 [Gimesia aquarii]